MIHAYRFEMEDKTHVALVMGEPDADEPTLVRVHSQCLTGDVFRSARCDCGVQLDEAMRIIRRSEDKASARTKLEKRFDLDYEQAEAILETKLFKLAKLEIESIRKELAEKRAEAKRIETILCCFDLVAGLLEQFGERLLRLLQSLAMLRTNPAGNAPNNPSPSNPPAPKAPSSATGTITLLGLPVSGPARAGAAVRAACGRS